MVYLDHFIPNFVDSGERAQKALVKQQRDITIITYHQENFLDDNLLQDDRYDPWKQTLKKWIQSEDFLVFKICGPPEDAVSKQLTALYS